MNRRRVALALALLALSCLPRSVGAPPPPPERAVLFLSADLRGYLGPCGCSENMRGGIERMAFVVDQARQTGEPVLFLDSGDALFGEGPLPPAAVPQQEHKARALARAFTAMGLQGRAVGPLDDARGPAFRAALALPELVADGVTLLPLGKRQVGVVVTGDEARAVALSASARSQGADLVVLLYQQPFEQAVRVSLNEGLQADLVLAARSKSAFSAEESRLGGGAAKVVQLQSKGRSLLRVDVSFAGEGRVAWLTGSAEREREVDTLSQRIELLRAQVDAPGLAADLKVLKQGKLEELLARREALAAAPLPTPAARNAAWARAVPLEPSVPGLPQVQALVTAYDREVGALNLAWAKEHGQACEAPAPGQPGYAGTLSCVGCHPLAFAAWAGSRHALAFRALEAKGKQYHLDCVGCHVTGWQRPGGACRLAALQGGDQVGCEACHGPGSRHNALPIKATIQRGNVKEACVSCHDPENSPHFVLEQYLPRIVAPGHGLPPPAPAPATPTSGG